MSEAAPGQQIYALFLGDKMVGEVVTTEEGVEARVGPDRSGHGSLEDALSSMSVLRTVTADDPWSIDSDALPAWKIAEQLSNGASEVVINGTLWLEHGDDDIRYVPEDPSEQEGHVEGVSLEYQLGSEPGSPGGSPQFGHSVSGVGDLRLYSCYEFEESEWFRVERPFSDWEYLFHLGEPGSEYLHEVTDPSLGELDGEAVDALLGSPSDYMWRPMTINGVDWNSNGETWVRAG